MKPLPFADLQTRYQERTLFVPGGWTAFVPEVTPDANTLQAFTRYLEADGMSRMVARQAALETIQSVFESGYLRGIRNMLYARAKEYAQRFPALVRDDGTLAGFDPTQLQRAYFPFERTGRRGKHFVDEIMRGMAANAEASESS